MVTAGSPRLPGIPPNGVLMLRFDDLLSVGRIDGETQAAKHVADHTLYRINVAGKIIPSGTLSVKAGVTYYPMPASKDKRATVRKSHIIAEVRPVISEVIPTVGLPVLAYLQSSYAVLGLQVSYSHRVILRNAIIYKLAKVTGYGYDAVAFVQLHEEFLKELHIPVGRIVDIHKNPDFDIKSRVL